jgi:hypothetical protein
MYGRVHSSWDLQVFLQILYGGQTKGENRGGERDERFSVHFNLQKPIQILFFKNFENCRSLSKMKSCTRRVPKIGKKH